MKNILSALALVFIICCCTVPGGRRAEEQIYGEQLTSEEFNGGQSAGEKHASGNIFEGTGRGYRGPVNVQVRMYGADILEIVIIDSEEDRFVGGAAMEELIDLVIMYNSTDVDAVSGATESSKGFLEAVGSAIMKR